MAARAWTSLWSIETLRYRGSGWWLDRLMPHAPARFLVFVGALAGGWFLTGLALAVDRRAYVTHHDAVSQLWYLPLHLVCVRALGGLWASGLTSAVHGLGLDDDASRRIRRGALGRWAGVGALVVAAGFITRDLWFGLSPDPATGLIPFDDPARWDLAALGHPAHAMLLAVWSLEWLLFGFILWLQLWLLLGWVRELLRCDLRARLGDILGTDGYRHAFTLVGQTATVSLVFALGNLAFIHLTGGLLPDARVDVSTIRDVLREMADLLSMTLLFVFVLGAALAFVFALRRALARAVDVALTAAADVVLAEGPAPAADAEPPTLQRQITAQAALLRALVFQREVDGLGRRVLGLTVVKSALPIVMATLRMLHMQ